MPSPPHLTWAEFQDRLGAAEAERLARAPALKALENIPAAIVYSYGMRGRDFALQLRAHGVRALIFDNSEASRQRAVAEGFELIDSPDDESLPLLVAAGQNQIEIMATLKRPAYYLSEALYGMNLRNSHGPARLCTDMVTDRAKELFALYGRLDSQSAEMFLQILEFRASLQPDKIVNRQPVQEMWTLPMPGMDIRSFCDVGAYDGDSLRAIKLLYSQLKRSFTLEPNPALAGQIQAIADELHIDNTHYIGGAWDNDARLAVSSDAKGMLEIREDPQGQVEGRRLDTLLGDEVFDLVKMDVESAEARVIAGGKRSLHAARCVAVAAYHRPEDILELPASMDAIRPDWKIAFAHYSQTFDDSIFYFWR